MLRFGQVVETLMAESPARAAIISRSGFDLARFGLLYSHAGIVLQDPTRQSLAVRQLYFDCAESRPRIYDQGIPGFLLSSDGGVPTFVSIVFLPEAAERALIERAQDKKLALSLLSPRYSANAYPFSTQYQNCNQWVIEMLAYAWGNLAVDEAERRTEAQRWLKAAGYAPSTVKLGPFLDVASWFVPLVYRNDHPAEELAQGKMVLSMPDSIEAFVHQTQPEATRLEICLKDSRVVVHRGWRPLAHQCEAGPEDRVMALE